MKRAKPFRKNQKLIVRDDFGKRFYCFYAGQDRFRNQLITINGSTTAVPIENLSIPVNQVN